MINMNSPKTKKTVAGVIAGILVLSMVVGIFASVL